jgi:hypothetical protein
MLFDGTKYEDSKTKIEKRLLDGCKVEEKTSHAK